MDNNNLNTNQNEEITEQVSEEITSAETISEKTISEATKSEETASMETISEKAAFEATLSEETVKKQKKSYFASLLWKLTLAIVIILVLQLIFVVPRSFFSGFMGTFSQRIHNGFTDAYLKFEGSGALNTLFSVLTYIDLMLSVSIGALVFYLLTKKTAKKPERGSLKFGWWLVMFLCCFGIGGIGQFIGSIVNGIILAPASILNLVVSNLLSGSNIVADLIYADDSWLYLIFGIITVGIVVPILEELIFRRLVINATCKYGYGAAIMISAFTFAVYHGNFVQFFYAFGLGLLFAYIYCKTGKLRYTVLLHMGYNLYAAMIIPLARKTIPKGVFEGIQNSLLKFQETIQKSPELFDKAFNLYSFQVTKILETHPMAIFGLLLTAAVNIFYVILIIIGIIFIIVFMKKGLGVRKTMMLGQKGTKRCAAFNYGAIIFYIFAAILFGFYYIALYLVTIFSPLVGNI